MAVKPHKLRPGSRIGIVAPSSPYFDENTLTNATNSIKEMGFEVVKGKTVYKKNGYLAGNDYERAEDINIFFNRHDIDGIICLRGGYGSLRILDKLDYNLIKRNPKVFVGYSDITALHVAINKLCGMVTFHGPMFYSDFGSALDKYTRENFLHAVTSRIPCGELKNPDGHEGLKVLSPGKAKGRIIGGNLSVIVSAIGTPYEIETHKRILFLEEVGEEPYRIDRMLTQLILSGKLHECSGVVLGQWTDCNPKEPEKSLSLMEVLYDRLIPLGMPVLYNAAFGHGVTKMTIPLGVHGIITEDGRFIITEEGVE